MDGDSQIKIGKDVTLDEGVELIGGPIEVGAGCHIRSGTKIYPNVIIGKNVRTGHNALIRSNTVIGDNCLVGSNCVIDGDCKIGKYVCLQTAAYVTKNTIIEDGVFMGPYSVTTNDRYMDSECHSDLKGPTLKKGVRVGANSTVLAGVTIGACSLVGAHSFVADDVLPHKVVFGVPAKVRRNLTNEEILKYQRNLLKDAIALLSEG